MAILRRMDGIQHNRKVSAGGVLHAYRNVDAAGYQTVLLVLHGAGADGDIGKKIFYIGKVLRVQHLVSCGHAGLLDGTDVHMAQGDDACQRVRLLLRIRLMHDTLVAVAGGTGLVGVDPGDD